MDWSVLVIASISCSIVRVHKHGPMVQASSGSKSRGVQGAAAGCVRGLAQRRAAMMTGVRAMRTAFAASPDFTTKAAEPALPWQLSRMFLASFAIVSVVTSDGMLHSGSQSTAGRHLRSMQQSGCVGS